ncbi:MAG: spore germination protein [Clostridiaceae bacterium]|nr:spore germination protein [Clostridiaceae bacterium]
MGNSCDLKVHMFRYGANGGCQGALIFIDGMVDRLFITESILRPMTSWQPDEKELPSENNILDEVMEKILCACESKNVQTIDEAILGCLCGDTVLLLDGYSGSLVVSTKGWDKRSVTEPQSETVVRGPREGFTESYRTNSALIRRKIKDEKLRSYYMTVGRKTKTDICIMYIDGIAADQVVEAVKYRIGNLDVDSILESGYIEEYIDDAPLSPFATIGYTEKPDVAAARMLEGRVAIVVDGTPFVLTVPMLFVESFQTTEDYYTRPIYASFIRLLRFLAYFITIFAPAIYIALTVFQQELIPTKLLLTIANAREGTPFPVFVEMLIMVFAFDILYEAGIRMPRPVGQAISIVGALVMGEAAVSAGLVGAPVVITIAITAVAGFLVPTQNDSATVLRGVMMVIAAFAGWYGISMGLIAIMLHIASLSSFGVPYFDGFFCSSNLQDSLIRLPLWAMVKRPRDIARGDTTRHRFFIPPLRPYESQDEDEDGEEDIKP